MADEHGLEARFAELAARLDPAMIVVTTAVAGERSGCLVGFHSQCSIDPPRYAVWVSKVNHTFAFINGATVLAVHVLESRHQDLAELFGGQTGDQIDKFATCRWSEGPGGVPLLDDLATRFVGRKVVVSDVGGDHVCVVLEPVAVEFGPAGEPMLHLSDERHIHPGHPA